MFDDLGKKLTDIIGRLRGKGTLSESDVVQALREVRIALLEADVALPVAKFFIEEVKKKAVGEEVLRSVSPSQMVIKIVHDALVDLLSHPNSTLTLAAPPPFIFLMVGLQGSGKTTMSAKLAFLLKTKYHKKVLLASGDVHRPAAQQQLALLGEQIQVATLPIIANQSPREISQRALKEAQAYDVLIFDTAGRLHIDADMMAEAQEIKNILAPHEILFVADALSGQDAVRTAEAFHQALGITGNCLSRMDGDSRGGAALSIRYITGQPLKLMGTGERPQNVELFDAQRVASRILDMGDIVSLVERAAEAISQEDQARALQRLQKGLFTLEDLAQHLRQLEKMGGLRSFLSWIPGMRTLKSQLEGRLQSTGFRRQLAIIDSMTPQERTYPDILNASRKRRIAQGSGTSVAEINRLLQQFQQMAKVMKQMKKMKGFPPA